VITPGMTLGVFSTQFGQFLRACPGKFFGREAVRRNAKFFQKPQIGTLFNLFSQILIFNSPQKIPPAPTIFPTRDSPTGYLPVPIGSVSILITLNIKENAERLCLSPLGETFTPRLNRVERLVGLIVRTFF